MLHEIVQSQPAQEFWSAFVFWDAKRPITAQILNQLDFAALARVTGIESDVARILARRQIVGYTGGAQQQLLFRMNSEEYPVEPSHGIEE